MPVARTIKLRRDDSFRWWKVNPVLFEGEPGFERDTGKLKLGDGNTAWRDLPYVGDGVSIPMDLTEHINDPAPHPVYDDGPSLYLIYQNAKV